MFVVFVLLTTPTLPDVSAIVEAYEKLSPQGPQLRPGRTEKSVVTLDLADGHWVTFVLVNAPIPTLEAKSAAAFSAGQTTISRHARHRGHLIVAMPPGPTVDRLASLKMFTRVVAAIAKVCHAAGIYDGAARATHPTEFYVDVAQTELPVPLWTGVSVATDGPGRASLLSLGMKRFGLPDLLFSTPTRRD